MSLDKLIGKAAEAVISTVQMEQFPEGALFTDLLDHGKLTAELLMRLAKELVSFHNKGAINDYIRTFGDVTQIRQTIDENYEQTVAYIGRSQTQPQFDETHHYTDDRSRPAMGAAWCDLESSEFENGVAIHLAYSEFHRHAWLTAAALYTIGRIHTRSRDNHLSFC